MRSRFRSLAFRLLALPLIASPFLLTSCGGGGGGGDDFIGAALVAVRASPRTIDSGDRTQITVDIQEVHENGIALKVRFPAGLVYVVNSSRLEVDSADLNVGPKVNAADDDFVYLVYYLRQSQFGKGNSGKLKLELEATDEVADGKIEVDADVDDPDISNDTEFNIESPEFGAEDQAEVEVKG